MPLDSLKFSVILAPRSPPILQIEVFTNKQNFVTNLIELRASLYNLACDLKESNKLRDEGVHENNICKHPSDTANKIRDWNSVNFSVCYRPKLGDKLKNIQESNFAKECYNNRNFGEPEKHGIEFKISATRIGFEKLEKTYLIVFDVGVIIGFSFSKQIIEFGKKIKVTGKINKYGFYSQVDDVVLLFSIKFGTNGFNFATLTDEMSGTVYDYERFILENLESKNILEILNEGGAIAIIGSDINMEGKLLLTTDFEINSLSEKACTSAIDLRLNNETMEKQFKCYERPVTQCDRLGPEEYKKLKTAYDNLLELYKKCPCERKPRPSSMPEDRLIIPPESRKKRDTSGDSTDEQNNYNRRFPECENTEHIKIGDISLRYENVMEMTKNQLNCCKGNTKRSKRQLIGKSGIWPMLIYYNFTTYKQEKWIALIKESLDTLSQLTCIRFERIKDDPDQYTKNNHILFDHVGGCSANVGRGFTTVWLDVVDCNRVGAAIHEIIHALGIWHEQSRSDRDDFVWIHYDNIIPKKHANYDIQKTTNLGAPYDFGSSMHYAPFGGNNIDMKKFSIVSLMHQYQNTMGQLDEPSFKDIKLLNKLYCTSEYSYSFLPSNSINYHCDVNEYELNYGKCKNGGYPDPLNNCKCRCPEGLHGYYCTEFKYDGCKTNKLTADVTKQYFHVESKWENCFFIIQGKKLTKSDIKPKRMLIKIEYVNGLICAHPCKDNYIKIKFLEDKTVEGARICCNYKIMPLTISAEVNTDVLIMKKGSMGNALINYQLELVPHIESSSCKEVHESMFDKDYTKSSTGLQVSVDGKWVKYPPMYGPNFCLSINRKNKYKINGIYTVRNSCVEDSSPDPDCYYSACFSCMNVEGFDQPQWFWKSPEGEWILVTHSGYVMNQGKN
ncbi:Metalloendopeptidase [Meloidogyne graminicola]|uniref:Metalloendopeptidase n=1 Tax=Meloidogyne graminicola TaxID=189291 RepID=A0A8S9ZQL0_9BILA|nr:Metalloendopeptidase [Meloidogyne graminicola]